MESVTRLPEGYQQILHIDLQKDKKLLLIVNGMALVIMMAMLIAARMCIPFTVLFEDGDAIALWWKLAVLGFGYIGYIILHEAVHAIAMKYYSKCKVSFGFTGMYAFAASKAYYCRRHYIIIALAPIVIWGIVLGILNFMVPLSWFYVVYFIQAGNISGAAGDIYVSWRMSKLPGDILIQDDGVSMTVYSTGV